MNRRPINFRILKSIFKILKVLISGKAKEEQVKRGPPHFATPQTYMEDAC